MTFLNAFRAGYWQAAHDSDGNWFWGVNSPSKRPSVQPLKWWICESGSWWTPTAEWAISDVGLDDVDLDRASVDQLYEAMEACRAVIRPNHPNGLVWNPCTWKFAIASKPGSGMSTGPAVKKKTPRELRVEERDARIAGVWSLFHEGKIGTDLRDERLRKILDEYSDLN